MDGRMDGWMDYAAIPELSHRVPVNSHHKARHSDKTSVMPFPQARIEPPPVRMMRWHRATLRDEHASSSRALSVAIFVNQQYGTPVIHSRHWGRSEVTPQGRILPVGSSPATDRGKPVHSMPHHQSGRLRGIQPVRIWHLQAWTWSAGLQHGV